MSRNPFLVNGQGPPPRDPVGPIAAANPLAPSAIIVSTKELVVTDPSGITRKIRRVEMVVEHANGTFVATMDPDPADEVAAKLVEMAKLARNDLIVPG